MIRKKKASTDAFLVCNMKDFNFKKNLGQNFIRDNSIIKKIIAGASIKENSLVIEIGPGEGVLTKELSKVCKNVLCYEIDNELESILDSNLVNCPNVDIIYDDFLKRDIKSDIKKYNYNYLYVVANIPYYITTPIIIKLISEHLELENITIMVQKEVGERFSASVGTRSYNSLTVFLNYYFNINKLFIVDRKSFVPMPSVDSVVISLVTKKDHLIVKNEEHFFNLIRDSFRFKRKNLRNNLKNYDLDVILMVLNKYHYDLSIRAEQLPLDIFVDISNSLN